MRTSPIVAVLVLVLLTVSPALADEVIFLNGDRLTGKIVSAAAGKLVLKTDAAGEIAIDLAKVRTFSTDEPVVMKKTDEKAPVPTRIGGGAAPGEVQAEAPPGAPAQVVPLANIAFINPPVPEWHGSLALNGLFTTGNTETEQIGFTGTLNKRWEHDRLTFEAVYNYGRQKDPDTDEKTTTADYGRILGKYDHFFTEKFYGYALARIEHDGVADLSYRLAPGIGVGYQWYETPTFKLSTEAGVTYVYEKFEGEGGDGFFGGRLAYAVEWVPVAPLLLYHTLEYLPSFEDFNDYLLNVVAGAKLKIATTRFFADFRVEYAYDSTPADDREKADTRILLGLGLDF